MNPFLRCAAAAALLVAALPAQGSLNMNLVSHLPGVPCATGGMWGIGNSYVLVGRRSRGWSVIDVRNPQAPVVSDVFPPSYPRSDIRSYGCGEVKSDGRWVYVTNEDFYQNNTGGVFIYDSAPDPMNPTLVNDFRPPELQGGCHNVWVDGNWLYCVSDGTQLIEVYDVSNKTAPVRVATLGTTISQAWAHDVIVLGGRAYCSLLTGGFAIYDVTNPTAPVLLGQRTYPTPFTHNAWPTNDRRYLYTTDENVVGGVGGQVRIWDISSLPTITQVGTWRTGPTSSVVHNVHVVDDLLYVSYYKEGVRVLSLQPDPRNPVEIAYYDTFPSTQTPCFPTPTYAGCWGVYPLNTNLLVASDMDNGVYLLDLRAVTHTMTALPNPVSGGQQLNVAMNYTNATPGIVNGAGAIVVTKFGGVDVFSLLALDGAQLAPSQTRPLGWSLTVPPGLPVGLTVEFTAFSGVFGPTSSLLNQRTTIPVVLQ